MGVQQITASRKYLWGAAGLIAAISAALWRVSPFLLSTQYLPHRYCYLVQPGLVWTNVAMDSIIAVSYAAIFVTLFWMTGKLRHLPELISFLWMFLAFGTFIVACGATHVMEAVTVWWPAYRLSAFVKVICAAASLPTAIVLCRIAPMSVKNIRRFVQMLSSTQQQKDRALASLVASEKLAVAGRISASISHEIRNPLESVANVLYLIRTTPGISPQVVELLQTAEAENARATRIANNTLMLYRESDKPIVVSFEEMIGSVLEIQSGSLMARNIRVETRFRTGEPLYGYPGELRQIVINLILNAATAIGSQGSITIHVQPRCNHRVRKYGYSMVIADNGPGIGPLHRPELFTLFFTTKGAEGTGMGLWLVKSIVEKHGGEIRFRSRTAAEGSPSGTVFSIWLPIHPSSEAAERLFSNTLATPSARSIPTTWEQAPLPYVQSS